MAAGVGANHRHLRYFAASAAEIDPRLSTTNATGFDNISELLRENPRYSTRFCACRAHNKIQLNDNIGVKIISANTGIIFSIIEISVELNRSGS
ncbi:hypothetical protein [Burkholderia sp. IMCC1007]|uniref:hypothetical protein n=1 Tax=Burkholderia sp. IMCC1007 TaxID=3004104 RepID=UPI0022B581A9|nr:hypothetical protein [Burkholderia sp. IMCC1007]